MSNVPSHATAFIGREQEVALVSERLRQPLMRLLTLTGPGGIGKTRLACRVAETVQATFAHGAWFVNLAPLRDPDLVASTIAHTLGVTQADSQPLVESLKTFLHDKHVLLVLDNFEQVIPAAPLVAELLQAAPCLSVLVTSRIPGVGVLYRRQSPGRWWVRLLVNGTGCCGAVGVA